MPCTHPICVVTSSSDERCLFEYSPPLGFGGGQPGAEPPTERVQRLDALLAEYDLNALRAAYDVEMKRRKLVADLQHFIAIANEEIAELRQMHDTTALATRERRLLGRITNLLGVG